MVSEAPALADLEILAASSPLELHKRLRQWKHDDYPGFVAGVVEILKRRDDSKLAQLAVSAVREDGRSLEEILFHPTHLTLEEAAQTVRIASSADSSFPSFLIDLAKAEFERSSVPGKTGPARRTEKLGRILDLLVLSVEPARLVSMLTRLCEHADPRIRSKAVLLTGKFVKDLARGLELLTDVDPRVRANAVEATWNQRDPETIAFLKEAAKDAHHRVSANAVLGLYLAGETFSISLIQKLLGHPDEHHRLAAIWIIGRVSDPRFQPTLESSIPSSTGRARANLLKAARSIKERRTRLESQPPLELELIRAVRLPRGRVHCGFRAPLASGLLATELIVYDGDLRVDSVRLAARGSAEPAHVILVLPARAGLDDPFARALVESSSAALELKRAADAWAILKYGPSWSSSEAGPAGVDFVSNAGALRSGPLQSSKNAAAALNSALESAVLSFPSESKQRHVIVVRDPLLPSDSMEAPAWKENSWQENAARYGVHIHALLCGNVTEEESRAWTHLTLARRGFSIRCPQASALAINLPRLAAALTGSFDLTYELGRIGREVSSESFPLRVEVVSTHGLGALEIPAPPYECGR